MNKISILRIIILLTAISTTCYASYTYGRYVGFTMFFGEVEWALDTCMRLLP